MQLEFPRRLPLALVLLAFCLALGGAAAPVLGQTGTPSHLQVIVPQEDRFTPFAQTVHVGDTVKWVNMDTDDHSVVSDNFMTTAGHQGLNVVIPGTDKNGGKPGTLTLRFRFPGTFVYYCRFHAHLDAAHQPAAPGPEGGIKDTDGNYGTPMMGVITVLPAE
jgi:plastocyanin